MSNSNSCPTCGEHIALPLKWKDGYPSIKVYPEVGDIVVCEGCDSKAEVLYIDKMEPDYLDVDYGNAQERGTA